MIIRTIGKYASSIFILVCLASLTAMAMLFTIPTDVAVAGFGLIGFLIIVFILLDKAEDVYHKHIIEKSKNEN